MTTENHIQTLLSAKESISEYLQECETCNCGPGQAGACRCNSCSTWNGYMGIVENLAEQFGCSQREIMQLLEVE